MKKPSIAFKSHTTGREIECSKNCIGQAKSCNLTNFVFSDGSSAHYDKSGKVQIFPKFITFQAAAE